MRDIMAEVVASITNNKMRIALTGFSIGWGMFILIVLLGIGNGVLRGLTGTFSDMSENKLTLVPGKTALPAYGHQKNSPVFLKPEDVTFLKKEFPNIISQALPIIEIPSTATYGKNYTKTKICGTEQNYMHIQTIKLVEGRDLNDMDIFGRRKVCIIARNMANSLFKEKGGKAVGEYVNIDGISFLIVGIYKPLKSYITSQTIFAPLATVSGIWRQQVQYDKLFLILDGLTTTQANEKFKKDLQRSLSHQKEYAEVDSRAIAISGSFDYYIMIVGILSTLKIFLWFVGIATLVAGIVGISNIMLITVKERTRELGVRKAMGASNSSIISLVLIESLIITLVFGYVGMMIGVGLTQLVGLAIEQMSTEQDYRIIGSTVVDFNIILIANGIMVLAGFIAGFVPARNAVKIKLVEALTS